ncbi:EAL domain-containing protein [Novosphingobium sp.]|uniref:EAL domain-containing protein n=1 Tax=Novosphingobium sp. TaxID=1874826 RepID=UPI0025F98C0F|nr:EAL domain-containing protein [Novosphingobium sp.]
MSRRGLLSFLSAQPDRETPENPSVLLFESRFLKSFEDSGRGWFWAADSDGRLTYVSPAFADLVASDRPSAAGQSVMGHSFAELFEPPSADATARQKLSFVLSRQSNFDRITQQTRTNDRTRWWDISGRAQFGGDGTFEGYVGFGIDVTEQLQSSQSATQLALYDALTGLPNRLSMQQRLADLCAVLRSPGRTCTVILLDLDRFKAVNDSLGHAAGDELLQQVAGRLRKIIGDQEKVFRLGGDEFQILLADRDDIDDLDHLADEIIATLSQPYSVAGSRCVIGASIGIARGPHDGATGEELMRNADIALYAAKGNGRGCCCFFEEELHNLAEDRRALEEDLRDAVAKGELTVFYQPVVSMQTSTVTGVEALVRWHHPMRGSISPAVFIPIAEDADLIENLGEWILRKACDEAAAWPEKIRVAVNVSPIQFANPALPNLIVSALANSGLTPDRLELEITEGVFLSESAETDAMFAALKGIGVRLALDDFGTGYSSLGYLRTAPFDKIKIDQSFVKGATLPGSRNGAIIAAIVALASALDMDTTAEGIESVDQLDLIRDLGVSHVQGYVYSKPIPNDALSQQLGDGTWSIEPEGPARQRSDRKSMYRRAGAILGCFYHPILVRNMSDSGAFIEGLIEVPVGTQIIVDFGQGHLTVATVRRAERRGYGIEFVDALVDDAAGGFCTAHRVAPYDLASNGVTAAAQANESRKLDVAELLGFEGLVAKLGLIMHHATGGSEAAGAAHQRVQAMFASTNPMQGLSLLNPGSNNRRQLTAEQWERLKTAVEESSNPQLKHIIALVVLTGARMPELLAAQWDNIDLAARLWSIPASAEGDARQVVLPRAAVAIIEQLPRFEACRHILANPRTRKPFNSVYGSWDAARKKAALPDLSINELRKSIQKTW